MATNIKTVKTYPLNGSTTEFAVPFEYLARKFVQVTLIGQDRKVLVLNQDYRFSTKAIISTTKAWGSADGYDTIEIRRYTSATERLVDFTDGSILRAYDLNVSQLQTIHVAEEARDLTADTIGVNNDGNLDARGRRIVNVADPVEDGDAINLRSMKKWNDSALVSANKAKVSEDNAKASEVNAGQSATTATQQAANAATSASQSNTARIASESARDRSEAARDRSEAARTASESARDTTIGYRNESEQFRDKAKAWAQNDRDVPVETGKFSAYHYSLVAKDEAFKLQDFNNIMDRTRLYLKGEPIPGNATLTYDVVDAKYDIWAGRTYDSVPPNGSPISGAQFRSHSTVKGTGQAYDAVSLFSSYHVVGRSYGSTLIQTQLPGNNTYSNFWFHSSGHFEMPYTANGGGIVGQGGMGPGGNPLENGPHVYFSNGYIDIRGSNNAMSTQGHISFCNYGGSIYGALYSERAGDMTLMTNGQGSQRYFQFLKDGALIVPGSLSFGSGNVILTGGYSQNGGPVNGIPGTTGYINATVGGASKGIPYFDSDATLKENIKTLKRGTTGEKLDAIRPVSYKFKDTEFVNDEGVTLYTKGKTHEYGVIAQDIRKVLPASVNVLPDGHLAMDPLEMIGFLVACVKDLREDIKTLQEQLKEK